MARSKRPSGRVGKGNPPREYCWPPGTSGNPAGRPPKKTIAKMIEAVDPFAAMVVRSNSKLIERRDSKGRVEQVSRPEATLERLLKKAMEGNVRALIEYLKISKAAQDAQRDYDNDLLYMAIKHRDKHLASFLRAERCGKPAPPIFPHPRDIVIHPDGRVSIEGPVTESEHLDMLEVIKLRDRTKEIMEEFAVLPGLSRVARKRHLDDLRAKYDLFNSLLPPRLRSTCPLEI